MLLPKLVTEHSLKNDVIAGIVYCPHCNLVLTVGEQKVEDGKYLLHQACYLKQMVKQFQAKRAVVYQ